MSEYRIEPTATDLAYGLLRPESDAETDQMDWQQRMQDGRGDAARANDSGGEHADVLTGLPVLVVEDDDLSREALELLLTHYGAKVCATASVEEAVRAFDASPPALVISDIALPDADGFGLIRHIRHRDAERRVWTPALAVSGMSPIEGDDPRTAGFDDFLLKPVDIDLLLARVRALVVAPARRFS